ncbi:hypothetical protein HRR83_002797 [Exophiala dermatitidis]|uniref:Uncharacterized protein n=2 Tax=Exophiala dermatitidis TaxID=5970 RepID=H6C0X0_EXODN|nr:uncharacterized protein HMPREF1120_05350 [Exophiala dermatitidis NIH/UT8656]KAJ4520769.1 hypothetical protein HRR74_003770 [Exophiala dermatitidis]EHY57308.1 hypothetical protein HMPREF1120_05350 [Exophiala dermatitidis NIH/UT8656]KAJ4521912.1 hypothetical protein HRR73_003111 [Exophiala dermatitidis]KAJ4537580.1 hypothetical protein HRR76_005574 [Exophiala dermatitidis]KAJ4551757.1 hypothetical protein HRR77_002984 [Exophiala dermatitidis]
MSRSIDARRQLPTEVEELPRLLNSSRSAIRSLEHNTVGYGQAIANVASLHSLEVQENSARNLGPCGSSRQGQRSMETQRENQGRGARPAPSTWDQIRFASKPSSWVYPWRRAF